MKITMKIGQAIKLARENVGLTEQELAVRTELLPSDIIQIEDGSGIPSLLTTQKIAKVLGLQISQLGTIADSILEPSDDIKMLQRRLLLSTQQILVQR